MRSTYSRRAEAQPNVIIDQRNAIRKLAVTSAQPHSKQDHRTNWWGRITYTAVLLSILFLGILAWRSIRAEKATSWRRFITGCRSASRKAIRQ